jgi:hypothetical protein
MLAIFAGLVALLLRQLQPTVLANPGVAAYVAPPATRLIPLPHKMDAPEIAVAIEASLPQEALAQKQETIAEPAKPKARPHVRKRRSATREAQRPAQRSVWEWNDGYRQRNERYEAARQWRGDSWYR